LTRALDGEPTVSTLIRAITQQEQLNFLLTNRIPRLLLTRLVGWFSRIENRYLTRVSIVLWRCFSDDLDFSESKQREFASLQQCFTRQLKAGARPICRDPRVVTSPCDAIVGAQGEISGSMVYQAKGFPYLIDDLVPDAALVERLRHGVYTTLRLRSSMYHRFHAPLDCSVREVIYQSGDTWNVNPIALKRVENLYCRNERAVIALDTGNPAQLLVMVPVAAILVASMKFHCLQQGLNLRYRGPNRLPCHASYHKGDEMGYFEQGSTIILLASAGFELQSLIAEGEPIKMGEPLWFRPET
jgi:phosphatidylserine decarboxylase